MAINPPFFFCHVTAVCCGVTVVGPAEGQAKVDPLVALLGPQLLPRLPWNLLQKYTGRGGEGGGV